MKQFVMTLCVLLVLCMSVVTVSAKKVEFCVDSDQGVNPFTPGTVLSDKGSDKDDCDGNSQNLKEFFCDGKERKHDNIKCSDFGAVCTSVQGAPDFCACPEGTRYNADKEYCEGSEQEVPEFSAIAAALGVSGAGAAYLLLRKRK